MSYTANASRLETASETILGLLSMLTHNAQTGRDSIEYAAKMSVLASRTANAATDFFEALSAVHSDNLNIKGEAACENSDDFADWARRVAHSRTYAAFEGVRGPALHVDLRPVLAQAAAE